MFPPALALEYSGIVVWIDRPVGFVQTGEGPDGPWERTYTVPYGEIEGTQGGDGDALDVSAVTLVEASPKKRPRFEPVPLPEFIARPAMKWIVKGLLPIAELAVL